MVPPCTQCLQVCKIFWSCTYMEIPDIMLKQEQFVGWMQCLLTFVTRPTPQVSSPTPPHMVQVFAALTLCNCWPCMFGCGLLAGASLVLPARVREPCQQGLSGEASSGSPWWKAKKWVLHITYRLFSRYSVSKHCKDGNDKAFSEMFVVRRGRWGIGRAASKCRTLCVCG